MDRSDDKRLIKRNNAIHLAIALSMIAVVVAWIFIAMKFAVADRTDNVLTFCVSVIGMFFSMVLYIGCRYSDKKNTNRELFFELVSIGLFLLIFLCGISDLCDGKPNLSVLCFWVDTTYSVLSICLHYLFWCYLSVSLPTKKLKSVFNWIFAVITIAYLILLAVNIFTGILFCVDESGNVQWTGEWIDLGFMLTMYLLYVIYIFPQKCPMKKKLALASFTAFPLLGFWLLLTWVLFDIKIVLSGFVYILILLAVYVVFFCDYKDTQNRLLEQKAELAEKEQKQTELQTALMLSQIRPHFLYNAITAIRSLCKNDPMEAYESLGRFSDYLRGNMDALENGRIIPFDRELEHIKTYLSLEKMRFGDELKVEYDIEYSDFSLPALSVQPIVENAVKHGATLNENGGVIKITAKRSERGAEITVEDNGPGFDANEPINDGKNHFGLNNVRNSLTVADCGELNIESEKGKGTKVTVIIKEKTK